MAKKILFWLDSHLLYFGIAKFLQEKTNFDSYSIVDINNSAKPFFENQSLVEFKKSWFYRDHLNNLSEPVDISYLKKFEKKYLIDLWTIAFGDRLFVDYNDYHKFSNNEILKIFEIEIKLFDQILDEIKPDYVIMKITDNQQNHLFHEICKSRGIQILTVNSTRLGYRFYISSDYDVLDNKGDFSNFELKSDIQTIEKLKEKIGNYSKMHSKYVTTLRGSTIKFLSSSIKYVILVCNNDYRKYFANFGRFRIRVIKNELSMLMKKKFRTRFLNNHSSYDIPPEDFVYFPLHLEPERTVLISAPYYSNQLEVIRNLSKSLPIGMKLCVKEHPTMKINSWHSISYYKSIISLPNVVFLHHIVSNEKIFSNCSMVATISGSSGLEVLTYEKPVLVFTDTIYSILDCVTTITNLNNLSNDIKKTLEKQVSLLELNRFIEFLELNSFEFNLAGLQENMYQKFYNNGFLIDVKINELDMISYFKENSSEFHFLTAQFLKKLF